MTMKLSFSTLGCPDWEFGEVFAIAADLGYNGIEVRGVGDEIYAPRVREFQPEHIEEAKEKLRAAKISIPILTSGAYLAANPNIAAAEFEVKDYVMLAAKLGVPYVRVLGECTPEPSGPVDAEDVLFRFKSLCRFAENFGVTLLIETNGWLAGSNEMLQFIERVDMPNAGVLWDIHHTVRFFGERPEATVSQLGKYIKHVHVKDSVRGTNGKITYMLTGYGDIPVEEAYKSLSAIGYDGFYSYEWVKRWSRELAEPGVAFYQYISYMRGLEGD